MIESASKMIKLDQIHLHHKHLNIHEDEQDNLHLYGTFLKVNDFQLLFL
ncbi:unnamed protein product [Paramecium sonneborni]|uniref:Uncharacterized protein n=1 Tax=Paramecium sonneborni TaxID=65129 RepID=A0A8S1RIW6_9CILI|nr:unnamed protein product [Paramecium sonneborni]